MIEFISGKLYEKTINYIIVDVNGVGYKILISMNTFEKLDSINKKVFIETYFHVTENSQTLFGFVDKLERELFEMLISVSGIGPKTAIVLLSAVKPDEFKKRLIAGEVKMLTTLPGIGPKTAKRLIVELKDKFVKTDENELPIDGSEVNSDAYYALISLGFKSNKVKEVIEQILLKNKNITTEILIKESLKKL
tara:strand:- start:99 stop:677 length:579 start_codon:yes stop_codon:yes gene_type:complete